VLAHEIAHVQEKHHLKVLQKQQLMSLGSDALSRKIKGEEVVQKLIGSGAEILARGLDKTAEFEADRVGVVLAARAGYDAFGLPAVLQDPPASRRAPLRAGGGDGAALRRRQRQGASQAIGSDALKPVR